MTTEDTEDDTEVHRGKAKEESQKGKRFVIFNHGLRTLSPKAMYSDLISSVYL